MGIDAPVFSSSTDSQIFPAAIVSSQPGGMRVVTLSLRPSGPILRVVGSTLSAGSGESMSSTEQLEPRLREVEKGLVRVEAKLDNVPTKTQLLTLSLKVAAGTLLAIVGGAWWIVQQYLAPILQKVAG